MLPPVAERLTNGAETLPLTLSALADKLYLPFAVFVMLAQPGQSCKVTVPDDWSRTLTLPFGAINVSAAAFTSTVEAGCPTEPLLLSRTTAPAVPVAPVMPLPVVIMLPLPEVLEVVFKKNVPVPLTIELPTDTALPPL